MVSDEKGTIFPTLKEAIAHFGDSLCYPLKVSSGSFHVDAFKVLQKWKATCEAQLEYVQNLVNDIFDHNKPLPVQRHSAVDAEFDARVADFVDKIFRL